MKIIDLSVLLENDNPSDYKGTSPIIKHWRTTGVQCVTFGVLFPKETRCESEIEFKEF